MSDFNDLINKVLYNSERQQVLEYELYELKNQMDKLAKEFDKKIKIKKKYEKIKAIR